MMDKKLRQTFLRAFNGKSQTVNLGKDGTWLFERMQDKDGVCLRARLHENHKSPKELWDFGSYPSHTWMEFFSFDELEPNHVKAKLVALHNEYSATLIVDS